MSIYCYFLLSIIFTKPYSYPRYRKGIKSISRLTSYLNTYKSHNYRTTQQEILHEYHNEEDVTGKNWEDESDLLGKTNIIVTANGTPDMPTVDIFWKRLLASKFLSALREEWFSSYEFRANTQISDIKYRYLESKYNSGFYPFKYWFDYILAHYFADSETIKSNVNKCWIDPWIVFFTKKLFYKNADE